MNLGTYISGGKTHTLTAPVSPLLILKSKETFDRLFLEADSPKAYFGNASHLLPYIKDALVFDGSPIPFDPLTGDPHDTLEACKMIWDYGSPTVQIDKDMLTAIIALKETGGTFFQLAYLFTSERYRKGVIARIKDTALKTHWMYFDALPEKDQTIIAAPILNRLVPLITDIAIRRIVSQPTSFTMPKTLIVDLPKGKRYDLLAALIMSQWVGLSCIDRPKLHIGQSTPIIHVDYLSQLPNDLKDKMLNTAVLMSTRTGTVDAEIIEPHFNLGPQDHLTDLPLGDAFVRLDKTHRVTTSAHDLKETRKKIVGTYRYIPNEVLDKRTDSFLETISWTGKQKRSKKK